MKDRAPKNVGALAVDPCQPVDDLRIERIEAVDARTSIPIRAEVSPHRSPDDQDLQR